LESCRQTLDNRLSVKTQITQENINSEKMSRKEKDSRPLSLRKHWYHIILPNPFTLCYTDALLYLIIIIITGLRKKNCNAALDHELKNQWCPVDRFHCHAIKNKFETVQWKKPGKWNNNIKRLIDKQLLQVSGLCRTPFRSYLPSRFTQLYRALHGDAILVYIRCTPIWWPEINKNTWNSLLRWKPFLFARELVNMSINTSPNTWNV